MLNSSDRSWHNAKILLKIQNDLSIKDNRTLQYVVHLYYITESASTFSIFYIKQIGKRLKLFHYHFFNYFCYNKQKYV